MVPQKFLKAFRTHFKDIRMIVRAIPSPKRYESHQNPDPVFT
jgi:hypothetical protein